MRRIELCESFGLENLVYREGGSGGGGEGDIKGGSEGGGEGDIKGGSEGGKLESRDHGQGQNHPNGEPGPRGETKPDVPRGPQAHKIIEPYTEPEPYEVRVRIFASSLNYRDWMTVMGLYNPKQWLPLVPCSDAAGEVIACGKNVTRFQIGDKVVANFMQKWLAGTPTPTMLRSSLGGHLQGCLREYACFHEEGLSLMPDHLDFEEAATLPCAALTAWSALEQANLQCGQTVLIEGTGGVSLFALQFAKLRGARVIITSSSDEKLKKAKDLGADFCIRYDLDKNWGKTAKKWSGEGVSLVIEVGGQETLEQALFSLKPFAQMSLIGVLSGARSELSLTSVLMQNIRIQGVLVGSRSQFDEMLRAIAIHKLKPIISHRFDLKEAKKAFQLMGSKAHFGKIVITI